jgi:amidase
MSDELMFRAPGELAALVRSGQLTARELVGESLARIDSLDPRLGAFVEIDHEGALAAAERVAPGDPRPFAGVPIAIKNNRAVRGLRLTQGCTLMRDFVAGYDHSVVRRLRDAGFVIVGTTKLPEYGILPVTEPRLHGPARNPWDPSRTPGGSSGGSAAALAAGMVPIAHGNDGGGSLRVPAACCGLVGLKAQRHRVSTAPDLGSSPLVIDGVLTRTVADTATLLDLLAGYEPGDGAWIAAPADPFAVSAAREPPRGLRIAFTKLPPIPDAAVDAQCAAAVDRAAALAAGLGHELEEIAPPWQGEDLADLFGAYFGAAVALGIRFSAINAGRAEPTAQDMEPMSWALWERSRALDAVGFQLLQAQLQSRMRALVASFEQYDALITPALAQRPLELGSLDTAAAAPLETFARSGLFTPFTPVFNASGQPAISLPLFEGDDGLPLAVQLVGRPAGEGALLALAAALEQAAPPIPRRPLVS